MFTCGGGLTVISVSVVFFCGFYNIVDNIVLGMTKGSTYPREEAQFRSTSFVSLRPHLMAIIELGLISNNARKVKASAHNFSDAVASFSCHH